MSSRSERFFARLGTRTRYARLSTKITTLYAILMAVVLISTAALMSYGVYFALARQAEQEIELSERQVVETFAGQTAFLPALLRADVVVPGVVLRVTDASGLLVYQNDRRFVPLAEVKAHLVPRTPFWAKKGIGIAEVGDASIYYTTMDVQLGRETYTFHFLRAVTMERSFLVALKRSLLLAAFVFLLVALLAGHFLSSRTLAPIRQLTQTARHIEARSLGERLPVPHTRDEAMELALTFNHMLDRLERQFARQRQFVSDASHELRTPVTVMLGYSDLLARWGARDAGVLDEGIAAIRSEAENMQQLIEKLLFLARADQARQAVHLAPVEFAELIEDVMRKMRLVDHDHKIELRQNDAAIVNADEVLLRQMIRVFLENSMKYTPAGGTIYAESVRQGDVLLVTLGDTGIGIPKEEQEKVFERFYRVDVSRTKAKGVSGTGLGLSIAKWIAERHGIALRLTSEPGKGTEIHLRVPVMAEKK